MNKMYAYEAPVVEIIEVEVENGYATSNGGGTEGYDPDPDETEF